MSLDSSSEVILKPIDYAEVEQVETARRSLKPRSRKVAGEIVQLLNNLEAYDAPETSAELYLDSRSGKYAKMLEAIVDVAAKLGMFDLARVTLVDLLRMTKVGRAKADIQVGGKLREERDLSKVPEEVLKQIANPTGD